ncbi:MAG: hypothetical protein O2923_01245 [Verrucomicrobia bacterium]|nr:hypothetical protein [Verrucomicrobiota bacterium]MDA1085419.1 hypothetical protein [Verrucomicrobiota bacterium]
MDANAETWRTGMKKAAWLSPGVLWVLSLAYALVEVFNFAAGQRGALRPSVLAATLATAGAVTVYPRVPCRRVIVGLCLLLSLASAGDMLLHAPGSSLVGISERFLDDFEINYYAGQSLYARGVGPYGIEAEYGLRNTSNSFPFPTYFLYWLCSGFGRCDKATTGFLFTLLNVLACAVLCALSVALARRERLKSYGNAEPALFLLFLVFFNSGAIGALLSGQTGTLASAMLLLGVYSSYRPPFVLSPHSPSCFSRRPVCHWPY